MTDKMYMYNGKVMGYEPSIYAKQQSKLYGKTYLDYHTLSKIVGNMILNNYIYSNTDIDDWELVNGYDQYAYDRDGNEVELYSDDAYDYEYVEIYQMYIISDYGAEILQKYTNQIVYYNEKLDMYLWGITHFGTGWDYVLTDVQIEVVNY